MFVVRKSSERGHVEHGWLESYHTFSFASYHDPRHVHFRALRVMNEDFVQPGQGFGTHPHREMEIVTYMLSGALEHNDSMGNGEVLRAGEFQRMSAGTGITHSEFNPSADEPSHLYQIWILPKEKGIEPGYEQRRFAEAERTNRFRLVASPDGAEDSLHINQDVFIYLASLEAEATIAMPLDPNRHGWLQILRGSVEFAGIELSSGDGVAMSEETQLRITAKQSAEVMLFDLT